MLMQSQLVHCVSFLGIPVFCREIKAYFFGEHIHLLRLQTCICEHANLRRDVAPVVFASKLLEILFQQGTHGDDAVRHVLDLAQPLLVQRRVVQDLGSDSSAVNRRIGVERSYKNLNLGVHSLLLLCGLANNRECTNALAIQALFSRVTHQCKADVKTYNLPCSLQSSALGRVAVPP